MDGYIVDRQRALYVENVPIGTSEEELRRLFDEDVLHTYDRRSHQGNLVTKVVIVPGKPQGGGYAFTWVEFVSESIADLAYQLWRRDPLSICLGKEVLKVQRPHGYVRRSLPPSSLQHGISPEVFSSKVTIDRQRALHVSAIADDATGQGIYRLFDALLRDTKEWGSVDLLLVTHVLYKNQGFAWVEFCSEAAATTALKICKTCPDLVRLGARKQKVVVQRPNGYSPSRETTEIPVDASQSAPRLAGKASRLGDIFSFDHAFDWDRTIVVTGVPPDIHPVGILLLFDKLAFDSEATCGGHDSPITHVVVKGEGLALVEFATPLLAGLVLDHCAVHREAVRLGAQLLAVQRPASLGSGDRFYDQPQAKTDSVFDFNYVVDRQRSLHVDHLPDDCSGAMILEHFEALVQEIGYEPRDAPAITHVIFTGRTFAWVEFGDTALADAVLYLCSSDPAALQMTGSNRFTKLLVQRPKGYKQQGKPLPRKGPSAHGSPPSPLSPSGHFDADTFPSLSSPSSPSCHLSSSPDTSTAAVMHAALKASQLPPSGCAALSLDRTVSCPLPQGLSRAHHESWSWHGGMQVADYLRHPCEIPWAQGGTNSRAVGRHHGDAGSSSISGSSESDGGVRVRSPAVSHASDDTLTNGAFPRWLNTPWLSDSDPLVPVSNGIMTASSNGVGNPLIQASNGRCDPLGRVTNGMSKFSPSLFDLPSRPLSGVWESVGDSPQAAAPFEDGDRFPWTSMGGFPPVRVSAMHAPGSAPSGADSPSSWMKLADLVIS